MRDEWKSRVIFCGISMEHEWDIDGILVDIHGISWDTMSHNRISMRPFSDEAASWR